MTTPLTVTDAAQSRRSIRSLAAIGKGTEEGMPHFRRDPQQIVTFR